mgnify:CR=1 FL=1
MAVTVDTKVKDIFEKSTSISMNVGATLDINLNTMIDWDKVTTPVTGNADTIINIQSVIVLTPNELKSIVIY